MLEHDNMDKLMIKKKWINLEIDFGSWCIGEYTSADGNVIMNTDTYGRTFGIHTIGASSIVHTSFNGTLGWIS
jgi:hypothetical protein